MSVVEQQPSLTKPRRSFLLRRAPWLAMMLVCALEQPAECFEVECFVEPYRSIDVAAAESGILRSCDVSEGDRVEQGQVLAKLDHSVHLALLAIGAKSKDFRGRLQSANAEIELRQHRLDKLEELRDRGHARQEEVERARTDVAIAQGNLLSAQEDLLLKELEYARIQAEIERRIIRAPLSGVVTKIRREPGEFVSVADPHVLTIVQLDSLLAQFAVNSSYATSMHVDQAVRVHFPMTKETATGRVEFISPVDEADSGTVKVKVRIENLENRLRSGQRCLMWIPDGNDAPPLSTPATESRRRDRISPYSTQPR